MKQQNFIESYERISIVYRHDIFAAWKNELYKLAAHSDAATVRDQKTNPGTCCPCIIFEADGTRAVAYLHSDTGRPAMYINNEYISMDYRDMLAALYGYFADVTAPDFADLPAVNFAAVSVIDTPAEVITTNETPAEAIETPAPAADNWAEKVADLLTAGAIMKAHADTRGYLYEIGPHVLTESQAEKVLFIIEDRETLAERAIERGDTAQNYEKIARESRAALNYFAAEDRAAREKFERRETYRSANEAADTFAYLTSEADTDRAAYLLACEAENIETATPTAANVIARAADELATMIHRDTTHARELLADVFKSWRNNLIVEVAPAC